MTRNRGIRDRREAKSSERRSSSQKRSRQNVRSAGMTLSQPPSDSEPPGQPELGMKLTHLGNRFATASDTARKWLTSDWRIPVAISLALTGGLTTLSMAFLLKLPAVPNCPSVFWPLASGSLRLHCAQLAAGKRTTNDLLEAIKLLGTLSADHPLYDEATRMVELWSKDILDLGEEAFNAGKLDEAIGIAKKVPQQSVVKAEVEGRIKRWQGIWSKAEEIYQGAEDALRKENWRQASTNASRLLSIDNRFWQTTKYQELAEKISITRDDISKLAKAKDLLDQGGLKNLQEAVKLASEVQDQSYVYQAAQGVLAKTGQKLFDLAEATLNQRDLNGALESIRQIPAAANLQNEVEDFEKLAIAQSRTWSGNDADFDSAIASAQSIGADRPLYAKARQLVERWQLEKADLAQLNRARQLAQSGRPEDIQAAIANAAQIPSSNPRSAEAQKLVSQLTADFQTKQDRPILDQAEQLASAGDLASLQSAIVQIDRIGAGRALFTEAEDRRQQWQRQIRQIEAQERALAAPPSPTTDATGSLFQNPQSTQSQEIQADQQTLETARSAANGGTIDDYANAIRLADGVPETSAVRGQAQQFMDQLSQQMYLAARSQSDFDMLGAIASAEKIPPRTDAYAQAQQLIRSLRRSLGQ
ncbi:chromosome segregation ATPase [Myxacorys almedinensis]|uniref:Chromosome segregation ATPase n=1 Tax=Myxacorys almedinensis A TaxID=2690445 RepID=A0A8J7Z6R2_9CYAN|nr:chromosome segregation ATPase [Myxacorys almedinensis]NDJ16500.1 chromosome segregation ATPase [Myxacorys almedinensis A]